MKKIILTLVATATLLGLVQTAYADPAVVNSSVNFRSKPSTTGLIIYNLKPGTQVEVIETVNRYWYKVLYNGTEGYVSTNPKYLTVTPKPPEPVLEPWEIKANDILKTGEQFLGVKYLYGGDYEKDGTMAFDCSGLMNRIFLDNGIIIKRSSRTIAQYNGVVIAKEEMRKGDLIFFKSSATTTNQTITHVAMYAGDGKIFHTFGNPEGVTYSDYFGTNWEKRTVLVKRVIQ